jgi:putative glutamine amidotransferase
VIGISCDMTTADGRTVYRLNRQYVQTVHEAGGLAVLLTHEPGDALEAVDAVDGVLLTGGADIDIRVRGKALHPKAELMEPARQRGEFELLEALDHRSDKPVLGICLGMQLMGVHHGCELVQHVPDRIPGGERHQGNQEHPVSGSIGSGLVASSHHQMLGDSGPFKVLATSDDGVLEAIELPGRPFYLGVQWHPERTRDPALGVGMVKRLVDAAIAAREAKKGKVK